MSLISTRKMITGMVVLLMAASLSLGQNQAALRPVVITDAGANDTYTGCPTPSVAAYVTNMRVHLYPNTINTGAATVNVCSLGAKTIKKVQGGITTDLEDGDIRAGQLVTLVYDGTNFQLASPIGNFPQQKVEFVFEGGGSTLTTYTTIDKSIDKACTSRYWLLSGDATGNLTVVFEKATFTTSSPSWSTANTLTLTAAQRVENTTAVAFAAKDMVRASVTGTPATITKATVTMRCF